MKKTIYAVLIKLFIYLFIFSIPSHLLGNHTTLTLTPQQLLGVSIQNLNVQGVKEAITKGANINAPLEVVFYGVKGEIRSMKYSPFFLALMNLSDSFSKIQNKKFNYLNTLISIGTAIPAAFLAGRQAYLAADSIMSNRSPVVNASFSAQALFYIMITIASVLSAKKSTQKITHSKKSLENLHQALEIVKIIKEQPDFIIDPQSSLLLSKLKNNPLFNAQIK